VAEAGVVPGPVERDRGCGQGGGGGECHRVPLNRSVGQWVSGTSRWALGMESGDQRGEATRDGEPTASSSLAERYSTASAVSSMKASSRDARSGVSSCTT